MKNVQIPMLSKSANSVPLMNRYSIQNFASSIKISTNSSVLIDALTDMNLNYNFTAIKPNPKCRLYFIRQPNKKHEDVLNSYKK